MKKRIIIYVTAIAAMWAAVLFAQDITGVILGNGGAKPALALVDFRGAGDAQPLMGAFNPTLYNDLQSSALFDLKPKGMFPLNNPQQPSDLRPEDAGQGYALKDWSGAPVNASHLVFGYTAVQNGVLVLYGYVYDVRQPIASAQLMFDRVADSPDEAGATRIAHKFASDIIAKFGGASLLGSRIYFTSDRGAAGQFGTELWVMDWDGNNQRKLTSLRGQVKYPSISADGAKIAFTIFPGTGDPRPRIGMVDTETGRTIPFYNQAASLNAAASFAPDGKRVYYSSSASGSAQIYVANADGSGFSRITSTRGNPSEPKVNPKNPDSLLFVDGPPEQVYRMNAEGGGMERITNGEGEASNPAWSPDGQHIAFAWTRGYQAGKFNIFVMDIGAPGNFVQLTHGEGNERNENPVWAPDGAHIVFSSTRTGGRSADFFHAGGWHASETANDSGHQQVSCLGGEVNMTTTWFQNRNRTLTASVFLALAMFIAGCGKHTPIPPPPPPAGGNQGNAASEPARPGSPTATLTAEPNRIESGQTANLSWTTTNANDVSINNGIGTVAAAGRQAVTPRETTTYTLTATGPNGSVRATATVTITAPPPPPVEEVRRPNPTGTFESRVNSELKDAFFDYDAVNIREDARVALMADADALKRILNDFPNGVINVEGHCDERGSAEYNLGLGDRRASSARDLLVSLGVPAAKLRTISYGKERPQCTEADEACYQKNRRAHLSAGQ